MRAPEGRVEEELTPRGDGNCLYFIIRFPLYTVEEELTPRGDGNQGFGVFFLLQVSLRKS